MIDIPIDTKADIADTILYWGRADDDVTQCLCSMYDIKNQYTRDDLIAPLDLKKKIDLLKKFSGRGVLTSRSKPFLDELKDVAGKWSDDRNILAHGFPSRQFPEPAVRSAKRGKHIPQSEIKKHRERAFHVAKVAALLWVSIVQDPTDLHPPLPKRPP